MPANILALVETALDNEFPLSASARGRRICQHYQQVWDNHPDRQSAYRLEHLISEAVRNICGDNGSGERKEPRYDP
jgi:hypothetical protein